MPNVSTVNPQLELIEIMEEMEVGDRGEQREFQRISN